MVNVLSLVSYPFLPSVTGGQKGIGLFYKYFSRYASLLVVTTKKNDPSFAEDYIVLNILSNSKFRYINLFYFFTLRKLIRQKKISHLILEHPYYGWLGVMLKWLVGVKLVVHSHNIEAFRWKTLGKSWWKLLWYYEKWVHRHVDHNFFIQEADLRYAIEHFGLMPARCTVATYGIEWNKPPTKEERRLAREYLLKHHNIPSGHLLLLFNGSFNYMPNLNGLEYLLSEVVPRLQKNEVPFTLLICGINIPATISDRKVPDVIIAGFVDDIALYLKGADIFLNPVLEGGGIKTKLVEALGAGMKAVSVKTGAEGVDPAICGGQLVVTEDGDWTGFAASILPLSRVENQDIPAFYEHFYWGRIAERAATSIQTSPGTPPSSGSPLQS